MSEIKLSVERGVKFLWLLPFLPRFRLAQAHAPSIDRSDWEAGFFAAHFRYRHIVQVKRDHFCWQQIQTILDNYQGENSSFLAKAYIISILIKFLLEFWPTLLYFAVARCSCSFFLAPWAYPAVRVNPLVGKMVAELCLPASQPYWIFLLSPVDRKEWKSTINMTL